MNASPFVLLGCALVTVVVTSALLSPPSIAQAKAQANVRIEGGDISPYYARIARDEIFHTDDWAVIVFYRPPSCIPADFNLLELFDVPRAFSCGPATIEGFTIWKNGPDKDPAPLQGRFHGKGEVPVWFVRWSELESAIADEVLTIGELTGLPSRIVGTASHYQETLHPPQASDKGNGKLNFVARGTLEDGRSFQAQASLRIVANRVTHIQTRIAFK